MAVFLTLCDKALLLQVSWGLLPEWMWDGTVYINVWNRHLTPIPTPIPITTIPTPIPIPITTIPTPIPTPPKRTTNDSDSDSDSGVGIVVWFRLRSRNRPRSAPYSVHPPQSEPSTRSLPSHLHRCHMLCNVRVFSSHHMAVPQKAFLGDIRGDRLDHHIAPEIFISDSVFPCFSLNLS